MKPKTPSGLDWRSRIVATIQEAISSRSTKEQTINDTRVVFSYFAVYFQHLVEWSPQQMGDYVREVCELAEKSTGVRAQAEGGPS